MEFLFEASRLLDAGLIFFFRLVDDPAIGFYLGSTVLALLAVVVGDISQALAHRINLAHFRKQNRDMVHLHNLSITALRRGDKEGYKAANRLANDTFGKAFFTRAALFTVSIWPVPFALGWLAGRFQGVDIPLPVVDHAVGYNTVFFPLYILMRIAYSRVKPHVAALRRLDPALATPPPDEEAPIPWSEVLREALPQKGRIDKGRPPDAADPSTGPNTA